MSEYAEAGQRNIRLFSGCNGVIGKETSLEYMKLQRSANSLGYFLQNIILLWWIGISMTVKHKK